MPITRRSTTSGSYDPGTPMSVNRLLRPGNETFFLQQAPSTDRLPSIGSYTDTRTKWYFQHRDP